MLKFAIFDPKRSTDLIELENPTACRFGITEVALPALASLGDAAMSGLGAAGSALGSAAGAIGDGASGLWSALGPGVTGVLGPALKQGAIGAGLGALTGQPGNGALLGALSGGLGGLFGNPSGGALNAASPGPGGIAGQTVGGAPSGGSGALTSAAQMLAGSGASTPGAGLSQTSGQIAGALGGMGGPLAILAALAQNANRQPTTPKTQPGFNDPYNPNGYINRSPVQGYQPSGGNWYQYGQSAEPQFFTGNQIHLAKGGALNRAMANGGYAQARPVSTKFGDHHVQGAGGGQDDEVDARLSPDEYIVDATTLSRLGDGSSTAGARKMDQFRKLVAHDAGSDRVVQKKTRAPQDYLKKVA